MTLLTLEELDDQESNPLTFQLSDDYNDLLEPNASQATSLITRSLQCQDLARARIESLGLLRAWSHWRQMSPRPSANS
jgi:hypothetical protein